MTECPIIPVNEARQDENGGDFSYALTPDTIAAGYVESRRVILQFPDGRQVPAEQVMITVKGIAELEQRLAEEGTSH